MKSRFPKFAFIFLSLLLLPCAGLAEMVSIGKPTVNMRSGPGTEHYVVWELPQGYPLRVLQSQGNWIQIEDFEGLKGWVYRPLTSKVPHLIVKADSANIRSGPGTRFRIKGKTDYGTVFRTLARKGNWAKVRGENGVTGWIFRSLLWGW